jgi:hypothetical protein
MSFGRNNRLISSLLLVDHRIFIMESVTRLVSAAIVGLVVCWPGRGEDLVILDPAAKLEKLWGEWEFTEG